MSAKTKAYDFCISAELLERLSATMSDADLTEIEFVDGERKIRLARTPATLSAPPVGIPLPSVPAALPPSPAAPAPKAAHTITKAENAQTPVQGNAVKSPMVGTAYLSSEPGKPAFIKVGDKVTKGQTLMIIEAMKVMNPLPSPSDGVVQSILVSDSEPIEFDQAVVILD